MLLTHYYNFAQAGLLQSLLESENILTQIFDGQAGTLLNHLAPAIPTRVMVRPQDLEKAREILLAAESGVLQFSDDGGDAPPKT